jgi:succinoglycan biosynthesis transport protein ExoP
MSPQVTIRDITSVLRRRKLYIIVPALLIASTAVVGSFFLPERYESHTTILIQKDQILNPLVEFTMAVALSQSDQLTNFNEIIFSRSTMERLLKDLGKMTENNDPSKLDDLIEGTRRKITTSQRGSDSFRILVADSDPIFAQRAATSLAQIYIQTNLRTKREEAENTVRFFEKKTEEYRQLFESQQRELLSMQQGALSAEPQREEALRITLDRTEAELSELERSLVQQQQTMDLLQSYSENIDNPGIVSQISSLDAQGAALYITELKTLSVKFGELTSKYTSKYPEVQSVRLQLLNLLQKAAEALSADIDLTRAKRKRLVDRKEEIIGSLSKSINLSEVSTQQRANYLMYKELYDGMRVKLEQARVSRDLGEQGQSKFVILDPALVPSKPTKPKNSMVIGGGIGLGLVVGLAAAFLAEYLDPTIRRRSDIEVFQKPIVAYLP